MKYEQPKGYHRPGYNWTQSLRTYAKTKQMPYVEDGGGHRAGEGWADQHQVDPYSPQRKYNNKNSSSFDEGVWLSKQKRRSPERQSRYFSGRVMDKGSIGKASVLPYMAGKISKGMGKSIINKPTANTIKSTISKKIK